MRFCSERKRRALDHSGISISGTSTLSVGDTVLVGVKGVMAVIIGVWDVMVSTSMLRTGVLDGRSVFSTVFVCTGDVSKVGFCSKAALDWVVLHDIRKNPNKPSQAIIKNLSPQIRVFIILNQIYSASYLRNQIFCQTFR